MLRQAKWLFYRDRVLEQLGALLLAYPRGRQFSDDFPGLKAEMRRHFDAALPAASAAVQLAGGILAGLLRQLAGGERDEVRARMLALDLEDLKAAATQQTTRRREDVNDPVALATQLASVAIFMARGLADEGTLSPGEYAWFLGALDAALGAQGEEAAEPLKGHFALPEQRTQWGVPV